MAEIVLRETRWYEYARYAQSHTTITLRENGLWEIHTKFSNGNRHAPQSMSAAVRVYSSTFITQQEEYLFGDFHERNLGTAGGKGGAVEDVEVTSGQVDPEKLRQDRGVLGARWAWKIDFTASQITSAGIRRFFEENPQYPSN